MMGLRKFFVLSAALALALIGSGTALGQLCSVASGGAGRQVRAEGLSELIDDIVVVCTPGIIEADTNVKVTVTLSDGAVITNPVNNTDDNEVATIYATQYITKALFDANASTPDNDFDETKLTGGGSTVEMTIPTWDAVAAATDSLRLRINGIHINAAGVGAGETVTATVTVSNLLLFGNTTVNVARTKTGLVTSRVGYTMDNDSTVGGGTVVNSPVAGLACAASKTIGDTMLQDGEDATIARIQVKEGFATAFAKAVNNDAVRIRLSFNDIPDGVSAYLQPQPNCSYEAGGTGAVRAGAEGSRTYQKTAADTAITGTMADYLELTLMSGLDANGVGADGSAADGGDNNYVKVNLSSGSGTAIYEINGDARGGAGVDSCQIPIAFIWTSGVELGTGSVSAGLAPVSSVGTAAATSSSTPWQRFAASGSAIDVIQFEECSTTLLFPFVTNQANYDTGIAISNTSQDAFGTAESAGACTTRFYGSMMGGGAAPDADTSASIAAGGQLVFLLSSMAPGFQGYLMVSCDFQFAHGLAFLTNGANGGTPSLAQSYLALVVPVNFNNRGVGGGGHEMLSN